MNEKKPWYMSKAVLAGIVSAGVGVAGLFGLHIPEGEVATLTDTSLSLVVTIAGFFGIYGRVVAEKKIG